LRNQQALNATTTTVQGLIARYLEWVSKHRAEATYYSAQFYLKSFASKLSARLRIEDVKPEHVNDWIEQATTWSSTSKHDAITHVQRVFSWAMHERILDFHPLHRIEAKPPRRRREIYYTPKQWDAVLANIHDQNFRDLVTFSAETGCRPFEARIIEARHCQLEHGLIVFQTSESKGEKSRRTIILTDLALEICRRLCNKHASEPIFRNTRNRPWTKDSVVCRFQRLSQKLGIPNLCAYGIRHTYATDALLRGIDSVVVAELMGHKDASQVARTYQHVAKNLDFLKKAAHRARDRDAS
jgi:integrase